MGNLFSERPELAPICVQPTWTCPITGLIVPKDPEENLRWRLQVMEAVDADPSLRMDLYTACSKSILFWVNAFCFTLRVFEPGKDGENQQARHSHLPFVTWPIQDEHILLIEKAIHEGKELLTDKSRDLGATWNHIVTLTHRLIFRADESHLMISRKEDTVDMLDGQAKNYPFGPIADPGTLFGKIDYLLSRLPEWMLPRMGRKSMHVVNLDNKTRIDGESSNASAGSSDRRKSIFMDEMAKMKEAESIKRSTRDVTACRLVCSTPNGAGTAFSKWRMSGQIPVFILPWWDHPEKGRDRYIVKDKLDRWQIRSPWYDAECLSRSPKEVAIELDMDHVGSGDTFFEAQVIEQHKKLFARPPRAAMGIAFKRKLNEDQIAQAIRSMDTRTLHRTPAGPWKLWVELINGRLDQAKTYIMSVDIGKGQGASNSVVAIGCVETREKVAEFADANTPPHELARMVCAAAIWVGGRSRRPLIIYENNGDPGLDFGRQLVKTYRYPNVYFDKQSGTIRERVGKRHGWRSSADKKAEALGQLRRAYAHGLYINRSAMALQEAMSYIHYETGGIGPAELVGESSSARKCHGDRVIADMLFVWCLADAGKIRTAKGATPERSFGYRMEKFKQAKKRREDRGPETRFNFTGACDVAY